LIKLGCRINAEKIVYIIYDPDTQPWWKLAAFEFIQAVYADAQQLRHLALCKVALLTKEFYIMAKIIKLLCL